MIDEVDVSTAFAGGLFAFGVLLIAFAKTIGQIVERFAAGVSGTGRGADLKQLAAFGYLVASLLVLFGYRGESRALAGNLLLRVPGGAELALVVLAVGLLAITTTPFLWWLRRFCRSLGEQFRAAPFSWTVASTFSSCRVFFNYLLWPLVMWGHFGRFVAFGVSLICLASAQMWILKSPMAIPEFYAVVVYVWLSMYLALRSDGDAGADDDESLENWARGVERHILSAVLLAVTAFLLIYFRRNLIEDVTALGVGLSKLSEPQRLFVMVLLYPPIVFSIFFPVLLVMRIVAGLVERLRSVKGLNWLPRGGWILTFAMDSTLFACFAAPFADFLIWSNSEIDYWSTLAVCAFGTGIVLATIRVTVYFSRTDASEGEYRGIDYLRLLFWLAVIAVLTVTIIIASAAFVGDHASVGRPWDHSVSEWKVSVWLEPLFAAGAFILVTLVAVASDVGRVVITPLARFIGWAPEATTLGCVLMLVAVALFLYS